jgi:hypothetical protein
MPVRWSRRFARWLPHSLRPTQPDPLAAPRCRPGVESLEGRATPAVTAALNAGVLTVTLGAASDTATVTGTDAGGAAFDVTGTGIATPEPFTGVASIVVTDGGANAGQSVVFNTSGAGTIDLTGAATVTGVETVTLAPANGPLRAASVAVTAATQIGLGADVTTTAAAGQSYAGPAVVAAPTVTLTAGASGGVAFTGTLNSASGTHNALGVHAGGTTNFAGAVGGTDPLSTLTTDQPGKTLLGASVTTTGAQGYGDAVGVSASAVTLTSTGGGNVSFAGTVDGLSSGSNALTVNTAGVTSFGGAVGTTLLGALVTDAPGTTTVAANVSTLGSQTYGDPVTVSGPAVTFATTTGGNVAFNGTLDAAAAATTAVAVNTGSGTTTFGGTVGGTTPLLSLTTDTGTGATIVGTTGAGTIAIRTTGNQLYNDAVRLNAADVTFAATQNGNVTFETTLNGTTSGATAAHVTTGGVATFTGAVGGVTPLGSLTTDDAGQAGEGTVIQNNVTTTGNQAYADAVTVTPASGVLSVAVTSNTAAVSFAKTLGGASALPVTVKAGSSVALSGNVTLSAAGSRFTAQTGSAGTGTFVIGPGVTVRADSQAWQSGDGVAGSATTSTADLVTNAPGFRDAGGTNAPRAFVLRQDGAVTDATVPAAAQFGGAPPTVYTILSDDSTLTLTGAVTGLAGPGTTNLTLASAQSLSLGATVNAPAGVVRLRSGSADVTQTGGGITAAGLGVRGGAAITLTAAGNAVAGPVAALATTGNVQFTNGAAATVGAVGADPGGVAFTAVTGVAAAAGTVTFTQSGTAPLSLTVAAPVSGSTVTATGGAGDDTITVNYSLGGTLVNGLAFAGNGGTDRLVLSDAGSATARTYTVNNGVRRDTTANPTTPPLLTYTGVESVSITGGNAGDTFNVTPDATASVALTGGLPTGATGEKLNLSLTGATNPSLSASPAADGLTGTATFSNRAAVTFSQMEAVSPSADIQVTTTGPAIIPSGGTATFTVTVKNAGTDTATGVAIADAIPAGLTATWTATASAGSGVTDASGTGSINTTATLAGGGTVTFTVTVTAAGGTRGTLTNTATATAPGDVFDTNPGNNTSTTTFTVQPTDLTAVGAGVGGGPEVKVFNADGTQRFNFFAYDPSYLGGVTVATGDVTGDGVEDVVTGAANGSSHVKVFDGVTGAEIASFLAFPGFTGGVNVAVAGGQVVAGAGPGGGPIVNGYHVTPGAGATPAFSFFAFDAAFRGGVQVGGSEQLLVVGAGPGGGPHVKTFDPTNLTQLSSFFAFPPGSTDGVSVAAGTAGGRPAVIVGAGPGAAPAVVTFDAQTTRTVTSAQAFDARFLGGVHVAGATTADGKSGAVVGAGVGGAPRVRLVATDGTVARDFFAFDPAFLGGVFVG